MNFQCYLFISSELTSLASGTGNAIYSQQMEQEIWSWQYAIIIALL